MTPRKFDADYVSERVFICMAVILLVARLVGMLFRRIKQPPVLGEIIAGILLGPSLLGLIPGNPTEFIFPFYVRPYLTIMARVGLITFMFVVGLEVDIKKVKETSTSALLVAVACLLVPFLAGTFGLGHILHKNHSIVDGKHVDLWPFALFFGVAISITAFPVLARIISERRMFRIPLGTMVLSAAAFADVIAWALLTVALAIQEGSKSGASGGSQTSGFLKIPRMFGVAIGFCIFLRYPMRWSIEWYVIRRYNQKGRLTANMLAYVLFCLLISSWFIHWGALLNSLLGAFAFGLFFPRSQASGCIVAVLHQIESFAVLLLLPLFFIVTGLSVDVWKLGGRGGIELLYVLLVSIFGKFIPGLVVGLLLKYGWRRSLAIGILMNTRGLTEIVILNIGKDSGLLDENMFTIGVIMAVITTVMAGPILHLVYPNKFVEEEIAEAEKARMAAEFGEEGSGAPVPCVVVYLHELGRAEGLIDAALADLLEDKGEAFKTDHTLPQFVPHRLVLMHCPVDHGQGELGTGTSVDEADIQHRIDYLESVIRFRVTQPNVRTLMTVQSVPYFLEASHLVNDQVRAFCPSHIFADFPTTREGRLALKEVALSVACKLTIWGGGHVNAKLNRVSAAIGASLLRKSFVPPVGLGRIGELKHDDHVAPRENSSTYILGLMRDREAREGSRPAAPSEPTTPRGPKPTAAAAHEGDRERELTRGSLLNPAAVTATPRPTGRETPVHKRGTSIGATLEFVGGGDAFSLAPGPLSVSATPGAVPPPPGAHGHGHATPGGGGMGRREMSSKTVPVSPVLEGAEGAVGMPVPPHAGHGAGNGAANGSGGRRVSINAPPPAAVKNKAEGNQIQVLGWPSHPEDRKCLAEMLTEIERCEARDPSMRIRAAATPLPGPVSDVIVENPLEGTEGAEPGIDGPTAGAAADAGPTAPHTRAEKFLELFRKKKTQRSIPATTANPAGPARAEGTERGSGGLEGRGMTSSSEGTTTSDSLGSPRERTPQR